MLRLLSALRHPTTCDTSAETAITENEHITGTTVTVAIAVAVEVQIYRSDTLGRNEVAKFSQMIGIVRPCPQFSVMGCMYSEQYTSGTT